jgi:hypothetical protein
MFACKETGIILSWVLKSERDRSVRVGVGSGSEVGGDCSWLRERASSFISRLAKADLFEEGARTEVADTTDCRGLIQ